MPAINPADCNWVYSHSEVQRDLNGTVVGNIPIYVCTTPGHMRHTIAR
ncbi:hypothetical protein VT930_11990 [Mycobacterium sherrisii]|nr:hypothetical protein [Mycobacterium sherrisii]MEC4763825.1 hypothetical protein [Mycobacterium sherrisii]